MDLSSIETRVRPVHPTARDLKTLQQIATESFTATFVPVNPPASVQRYVGDHYQLPQLEEELLAPSSATFFLEANGQPIGYLKLNWGPTQTEQNFPAALEIQRIYLLPRFWGRHLGERLMNYALNYARAHRFKQVWLGVWQKNRRAQRFYARFGFKPAATHQFIMGDHPQTDDLLLLDL